jgi:hypothetical protein
MSRGLADTPEPQVQDLPTNEETNEAIQELFSMVSFLFAKVDTLEKVIGHAVDLPEAKPFDRKTFKGL